jgi:excisionase family DNA binding protein
MLAHCDPVFTSVKGFPIVRSSNADFGLLHLHGDLGEPLLLRASEVARLLGIGRSKVYEMMQTGELPTVRIGSAVRVPRAALYGWIDKRIMG